MKKLLASITILLLLLIVLAGAGLYWALQGPYAGKLVNQILAENSDYPITVRDAKVQYPGHISLKGIIIEGLQEEPLEIESADIWVNSASFTELHPVIDSVLINGLNLQDGLPDKLVELKALLNERIRLHQIAISSLDYSNGEIIIRDGSIQVREPHFDTPEQLIPYGTIQLSAGQIYWQGEAVNDLLMDGDYLPDKSTIYGLSFSWRQGKFSGQAEQLDNGWSLVNATIDSLRLNPELSVSLTDNRWNPLLAEVSHINSLDILDSSLTLNGIGFTNLDLSVENLDWPFDIQAQNKGYLSLDAESIRYMNQLWLEPALELGFTENSLQLSEFSTGFQEGQIQAKGEISSDSVRFSELTISGVKWIAENITDTQFLTQIISEPDNLSIDKLNIRYSQFIQLASKPNWQVSGFSAEGERLEMIRKGKIGFWNGQLTINASNASFEEVISDQPILRMESKNGEWRLTQAILPLENGLLEAWGQCSIGQPSQPWKLEISADGLPFSLFTSWIRLPVALNAITEFQLKANGLAGDDLMLQHSLSGTLKGSMRDAALYSQSSDSPRTVQPVELSEVRIKANRGKITFEPVTVVGTTGNNIQNLKGSLMGELDLVPPQDGSVLLKLTDGCDKTTYELLSDTMQKARVCDSSALTDKTTPADSAMQE